MPFVLHDWGSILGLDYAMRRSENVRGIAFTEALIPSLFPIKNYEVMGPGRDLFRRFRDPEQGKALIIDENLFVEVMLPRVLIRKLSEAEPHAYSGPFLDPASRYPIHVWPNELSIGGTPQRTPK